MVAEIPGGFRVDDAEGKAVAYTYGLDPRDLPAAGHQRLTGSVPLKPHRNAISRFGCRPTVVTSTN